jgi:3-dehydroquinate synthase
MNTIDALGHRIVFSENGYATLNEQLAQKQYSKLFLLVDSHTHEHCAAYFLQQLSSTQDIEIIEIEPGESHKQIDTCMGVWETLSDFGGDRKSLLINLGGGVVTDLGGFVAATFKRGIDFINVPTSLLAMVDAAVGGKTGVDLGVLKNQIGVITPPTLVLVDPQYLQTLPEQEFRSGYAEMLKHGLIADPAYFEQLSAYPPKEVVLLTAIHHSIHLKNEVVLKDPKEAHLRKILNFGHTLGHAIESYFLTATDRPTLLHGEAIAIGMILEAYLSTRICGLPLASAKRIKEVFSAIYPKIVFDSTGIEGVLDLLQHDKKNTHGSINYVLLSTIGIPEIDVAVSEDLYPEAFAFYQA